MYSHSNGSDRHEHGPEWGVVRCACGRLYLKLGPMRLEFTPEQFHQLHLLIRDAGEHFGVFDADGMPQPAAGETAGTRH